MLDPVWQAVDQGRVTIITSELTLLETLAKPLQTGDEFMEKLFRELLIGSGNVELHSITRSIIEEALLLRANVGLKTPDSIHAATALSLPAALILTNDLAFKRLNNDCVRILSEFV
jgi:predicted nucleic acid-binding protein